MKHFFYLFICFVFYAVLKTTLLVQQHCEVDMPGPVTWEVRLFLIYTGLAEVHEISTCILALLSVTSPSI